MIGIAKRAVALALALASAFASATPLQEAIDNEDEAAVAALLAAGADANERDYDGLTPLHWAVGISNVAMVRALLAAGADIDAAGETGHTPLHWAVSTRFEPMVAALLDAGAAADAMDAEGDTPLHWAAREGPDAVVAALLAAGADVNARNHGRRDAAACGGERAEARRRLTCCWPRGRMSPQRTHTETRRWMTRRLFADRSCRGDADRGDARSRSRHPCDGQSSDAVAVGRLDWRHGCGRGVAAGRGRRRSEGPGRHHAAALGGLEGTRHGGRDVAGRRSGP